LDLEAAETSHLRDPRDQISYKKTAWQCPCQGCKKAEKRERERLAELFLANHDAEAKDGSGKFGRMADCMTNACDCSIIIEMILGDKK